MKAHRPSKNGAEVDVDSDYGESRIGTGGGRGTGQASDASATRRPSIHIKKGVGQTPVSDLLLNFTPKWNWVSESEASHLKSRAAHFDVERNFLEINQDFSVFQELLDYGLNLIKPERRELHRNRAETIAKQLYLTQLVWTVMSAMASFRHREGWTGGQFDKLVSDEALTAAVLPRVYVLNDVKRYVKSSPSIKPDLLNSPVSEDDAA